MTFPAAPPGAGAGRREGRFRGAVRVAGDLNVKERGRRGQWRVLTPRGRGRGNGYMGYMAT